MGSLRGLQDTRMPMLLAMLAYWLLGVPLGAWLAFGLGPRSSGHLDRADDGPDRGGGSADRAFPAGDSPAARGAISALTP